MKEVWLIFVDDGADFGVHKAFTSKKFADDYLISLGLEAVDYTEPKRCKVEQ